MNKQGNNFLLFKLFLMQLSIAIPLIMLNVPSWLSIGATLIVYSPLLFGSMTYAVFLFCAYDIIRPALYIWALVCTIQGNQDSVAIAFYIISGLQAITMLKRLVGTISIIYLALTASDEKAENLPFPEESKSIRPRRRR